MVAIDSSVSRLVDFERGVMSPEIFSSREIYEQEMEQIFSRTWLFVGHESQIPRPGDFILSRMGEENVIVARDRDGKIHVLLNACRHRGNPVCRYDHGNAFAFQCTFHGWVYNSAGALEYLPRVDGGYDAMPKEEWGLIKARVEVFQGSIWANFDQNAPGFMDYLGGCEQYLAPPFLDTDGSDDGAEILGGVMKWRIGMNWKVPMPDNDSTHGWITHRSLNIAMGVGPSGARAPQRRDPSDLSGLRHLMQVAFPEGHTTAMRIPTLQGEEKDWAETGQYDDWPIIKDYIKSKYPSRKQRLGYFAYLEEGPHVFPNMGWFGRVIRILHPQGPDACEMWSYFLVDKAAPDAVKEAFARYYERWYGPGGMTQKDDMENWYNLTKASRGAMTRKMHLNMQLRISEPPVHGPSTYGLPGLWAHTLSDFNTRMFFKRWAEMMVARDWDELRTTPVK